MYSSLRDCNEWSARKKYELNETSYFSTDYNCLSLALSTYRSDRWLHGGTGCTGGAVASEGGAPAKPRARAAGEAFQLQSEGNIITLL